MKRLLLLVFLLQGFVSHLDCMARMPLSLFAKATKSSTAKRLLNAQPATSHSLGRVIANPVLQTQRANYAPSRNVWTTSTQNNANQKNQLALLLNKAQPRRGYLNAFGKGAALGATANAICVYTGIIDRKKHPIADLAAYCTVLPLYGPVYCVAQSFDALNKCDTVIFPSDFTRSNIDRCNANGKMREGFISFAAKNIAATDSEMIETIGYLLKRYPESRTRLMDAAFLHLHDVHPLMFKNLIFYSSKEELRLCIVRFYTQMPSCEEDKKFRKTIEKLLNHNASLQELIYLHYANNNYWGVKEKYSLSNPLTLKFPLWLYNNSSNYSLEQYIHDKVYQTWLSSDDFSSLPANYHSYIYDHIFRGQDFNNVPPIYRINILNAAMQNYDQGALSFFTQCSHDNHQTTQSEKHFCANIASTMGVFKAYSIKRKSNAIALFKRALAKEREEHARGNYVFYHARLWYWDLAADVYKELHNITNPTQRVGNDYTFLRFDSSTGNYGNALFLNVPLFGNSQLSNWGNSTAQLLLQNSDWSYGKWAHFTPLQLFSQYNLGGRYTQYSKEFDELTQLHAAANPSKIGSLLMVVVDDKNVNAIYPARNYASNKSPVTLSTGEETLETRKIIAELKQGKLPEGGDSIEYVLPLDKEYALNPHKGPKIYALNACDPAKYKEYTDYRDQLFAKIKADMQGSKA